MASLETVCSPRCISADVAVLSSVVAALPLPMEDKDDVIAPVNLSASQQGFRLRVHVRACRDSHSYFVVVVEGVPADAPGLWVEGTFKRAFRNWYGHAKVQTEGIRAPLEDASTARLHADGTLMAFVCGYTAAFRGRVSVHAHAAALTMPAPHFATLRDQHFLCDVVFRVDNREFTAHRVVLAAASSVFRSMFGGGAATDAPIQDTATAASFEMFLVYLYTGAVADCVCVNTMVDLLELADRYDVDHLKHICVERLLHVDIKNAVVVLRAANERPVVPEEVLVVATQTVIANMQAVMGMPEWADFASAHPVAARCLKATWAAFNLQPRNMNNNIITLD